MDVSSRPLPRLEGSQRSLTGALPVGLREDQQQRPRRTERGRALQLRRAEAHQPGPGVCGASSASEPGGNEGPRAAGGLSAPPSASSPRPESPGSQACRRLCRYRRPKICSLPAACNAEKPRGSSHAALGALVRPRQVHTGPGGGAARDGWPQGRSLGDRSAAERSCACPPGHQCSGSLGPQDWSLGLQDAARCVWICPVPLWGKNHPKWAFRHRHIPLHSMVFRLNVHFSFLPRDALLTSAAPAPAPGRGLTTCGSEPRALDESLG